MLDTRPDTAPVVSEAASAVASDLAVPPEGGRLRRAASGPGLTHYNRLVAAVVAANLVVAWFAVFRWGWFASDGVALASVSAMVVANLTAGVLIRQQYVINALFRIATAAPTTWPLPIRRLLGKVYHFGGIHVGATVAATAWYLVWGGAVLWHAGRGLPGVGASLVVVTLALVVLLLGIVWTSLPSRRATHHDTFERMHRFGGWAALALFWLQTAIVVAAEGGAAALLTSPTVWALTLVTGSVALPWLRLRKVPVELVRPSDHVVIARFDHGVDAFPGSSSTLSRSPLMEWHAFANAPSPGRSGFRITISRAGDWTGELIDELPTHLWVKGIPTAGVANIEKLFTRVVYITTGSGIGICLPHLLAKEVPSTLVWATRSPRDTYGDALVDEVLAAQPDALIWDTSAAGKPDMVQLAYQAYRAFDAEAVICISNKKLTWQVVSGMERRGIPAYGAIWDS